MGSYHSQRAARDTSLYLCEYLRRCAYTCVVGRASLRLFSKLYLTACARVSVFMHASAFVYVTLCAFVSSVSPVRLFCLILLW